MIQTLLLDMDGVLVDVRGSFRRAIDETVEQLTGAAPPPGRVQAMKDAGGFNNDWVLSHAIVRETHPEIPFETVRDRFQARYRGSNFDGLIATEPPAIATATLRALAGRVRLGLVTGRPEADAGFTLRRFGWDALVPVVVGMDRQAGREKPDPFGLELALADLGADAATAAYAGDTGDDMRAARAAGVRPIGVVPPGHDLHAHGRVLMDAGAEVVLSSADTLLLLVGVLGAGEAGRP